MFRPRSVLALSIAYVLLCADGAAGQTVGATTGTIEGTVTDTTGARLPGVTITAASDALLALRTTESAADGSYRFSALPPGSYRLLFTLAGFETVRQDVPVTLGVATSVIATLEPAGRQEVVIVEGGARVVDRRATMIATVFDDSELRRLLAAANPRSGFNVNPNGRVWWERFKWDDADGDGLWQPGEEFDPVEKGGDEAIESIDPDLKLPYVHEVTARVEREAARGLFIGTGVVWRGERQQGVRQRASWPFEAFNVARAVRDPGPDAVFGTGDDGPEIQVFDLRPDLLGNRG